MNLFIGLHFPENVTALEKHCGTKISVLVTWEVRTRDIVLYQNYSLFIIVHS